MDYCFFGGVGEDNMEESGVPTTLILYDDTVDAI